MKIAIITDNGIFMASEVKLKDGKVVFKVRDGVPFKCRSLKYTAQR